MKVFVLQIITLYALLECVNSQSSPCPNIVQFESNSKGKYLVISIPPHGKGKTVVEIELSYFGKIIEKGEKLKLLKDALTTVREAEEGKDMKYVLYYPESDKPPNIVKVKLNYNNICVGQDVPWSVKRMFSKTIRNPEGNDKLSSPITASQFSPSKATPAPPPAPKPTRPVTTSTPTAKPPNQSGRPQAKRDYQVQCGIRQALNTGGTNVILGEHPWMVAIYNLNTNAFICGGSLITKRFALTAAHCLKGLQSVRLQFGKYNLNQNEQFSVSRKSEVIITHPAYNENTAQGDIALVYFPAISFSNLIRPICIWQFSKSFDRVIKSGFVTGWARSNNPNDLSDIPNQTQVRMLDTNECRLSNPLLAKFTTAQTFCAVKEGTSTCRGDPGSGFYFEYQNKWFLRGVTSQSVGHQRGTDSNCDVSNFAVLADLSYNLDWIKHYVDLSEET